MTRRLPRPPLLPAAPIAPAVASAAEAVVRAHADRDGFDASPVLSALGLIDTPRPSKARRSRRTAVQARTSRPWRQPLLARAPLTDDEVAWMVEQGYARPITS